jgi:hypothetical protein
MKLTAPQSPAWRAWFSERGCKRIAVTPATGSPATMQPRNAYHMPV